MARCLSPKTRMNGFRMIFFFFKYCSYPWDNNLVTEIDTNWHIWSMLHRNDSTVTSVPSELPGEVVPERKKQKPFEKLQKSTTQPPQAFLPYRIARTNTRRDLGKATDTMTLSNCLLRTILIQTSQFYPGILPTYLKVRLLPFVQRSLVSI